VSLDVPVVMVVYNRPELTAQVFAAVGAARPPTLLVVADGPRADHPTDAARCRAVREIVDAVDWPCEVTRNVSEHNLGCDVRVETGLDWVFALVDRAIVFEDDVVAVPSFFPWCAAMLDRYDGVGDVMHVSGRNPVVRWGPAHVDHLLARRASVYGWATWASAWHAVDHELAIAHDPHAGALLDRLGLDPLVREHAAMHLRAARSGGLAAWDARWSTARILAGGWSVVAPVNLVDNRGFGEAATHTVFADDLRAALPCGDAPSLRPGDPRPEPDPAFERACIIVELLSTYRDPEMAARLARFPNLVVGPDGSPDLDARLHLAPWDAPDEALFLLRHLRAAGMVSPTLDDLERAFSRAVAGVASSGAP
jgi:hypothetical protein